MMKTEFDIKSDSKFYERISLGLGVVAILVGMFFVVSGFAHVADNPADAIFRFVFGGAIALGAGKILSDHFSEICSLYKAMLGEREKEDVDG